MHRQFHTHKAQLLIHTGWLYTQITDASVTNQVPYANYQIISYNRATVAIKKLPLLVPLLNNRMVQSHIHAQQS